MRVLFSLAVLAVAPLAMSVAQERVGGPSCLSASNGNHNGWAKQLQRDADKNHPPGWDVRPARDCSSGSGGGGDTTPPPPPPPPPGDQITGHVYFGAGVQANVRMDLTGAMSATALTDANGVYGFFGLVDGSYTVCEEIPSGSRETYPTVTSYNPACPTGAGWSFTLSGTNAAYVDFQNQPL